MSPLPSHAPELSPETAPAQGPDPCYAKALKAPHPMIPALGTCRHIALGTVGVDYVDVAAATDAATKAYVDAVTANGYVRTRVDQDYGRMGRQQEVMLALVERFTECSPAFRRTWRRLCSALPPREAANVDDSELTHFGSR